MRNNEFSLKRWIFLFASNMRRIKFNIKLFIVPRIDLIRYLKWLKKKKKEIKIRIKRSHPPFPEIVVVSL